MSATYPRAVRLVRPEDYKKLFSDSIRVTTSGLILLFRKNGLNYGRLGLAISKKHIKLAVQRNLLKRLIREQFRLNQDLAGGFDLVFLTRTGLSKFDRQHISQQLAALWEKFQQRQNT